MRENTCKSSDGAKTGILTSYRFSNETRGDLFIPSSYVNEFECTLHFDWTLNEMSFACLLNAKYA